MAKRVIRKSKEGKTHGRSRGPLAWFDELGRKTTKKIIEAIKSNRS